LEASVRRGTRVDRVGVRVARAACGGARDQIIHPRDRYCQATPLRPERRGNISLQIPQHDGLRGWARRGSSHREGLSRHPLGTFLRRTSLDELPQIFNVLEGKMSFVGPRPHAVAHNEEYRKLINGYMIRHKVRPGITGWAQVNGLRGETSTVDKMHRRVQYDLDYLKIGRCGWT